jgi:hypothetical protein
MEVVGIEGRSVLQLEKEIWRGGKFVVYLWVVSLAIVTFKRSSKVFYIPPGESALVRGLPYTLCSVLFGWWGIPWGILYTAQAIIENTSGGKDVTPEMILLMSNLE